MALPPSLPYAIQNSTEAGQYKLILLPEQVIPVLLNAPVCDSKIEIRPYVESDFEEVSKIYQIAFAEPPWNEFKKCDFCAVKYSQKEVAELSSNTCNNCQKPLILRDFWGEAEVRQDLEFSLSQPFPVVFVAVNQEGPFGMIWGCLIPLDQFTFLKDHVSPEAHYLDDIAVRKDRRMGGVGTLLGTTYLDEVTRMGIGEVVLRTDERNEASMALFKKLGFHPLYVESDLLRDPDHFHRIYLKREGK